MAVTFSKIHLNYISTAPIFEIITSPDCVASHFGMLKNINDYSSWYKKIFSETYSRNKDGGKSKIKYPFVRNLGQFLPVSGYEMRNIPLYKGAGGNIDLVSKRGRWMLPQKLEPNWKLNITPEVSKEFNISNSSIKPEIHMYPFGMLSYQIRIYVEFQKDIELKPMIEFLKVIEEGESYHNPEKKFSLIEIVKLFHKQILQNVLNQQKDPLDQKFSSLHRILTINQMNGSIHPKINKKELAGIIGRISNWDKLNFSFVNNKVRSWIDGIFDGQFFLFDPTSTILMPLDVAEQPEFHSYIRKRMRRHFSSLIEFATIQSQFSKLITQEIQQLLELAKNSSEKKRELDELVKRLNDIGWIRTNWKWEMRGGHKQFYNKIKARIGLDENIKGTNEKLKEAEKILKPEKSVTEIKIDGNGNVVTVGDGNVITVMNQKFKGTDKEKIGEDIALLRGEIQKLNVQEKIKSRLTRTTENLEDEVLDDKPDVEAIANQLNSIKDELGKNGIEFNMDSGWGQRLKSIGKGIAKFAPKILPLIPLFI